MEKIKTLLSWLLLPLMGVVYALLQRNRGLQDELSNEKAEREMDSTRREIEEEKANADAKEADYRTALQQFHDGGDGK